MLEKATVFCIVFFIGLVLIGMILGRILRVLGDYLFDLATYVNAEADRLRQKKTEESDRRLDEHEDINKPF